MKRPCIFRRHKPQISAIILNNPGPPSQWQGPGEFPGTTAEAVITCSRCGAKLNNEGFTSIPPPPAGGATVTVSKLGKRPPNDGKAVSRKLIEEPGGEGKRAGTKEGYQPPWGVNRSNQPGGQGQSQ